ncbi:hypothetical protein GCM10027610_105340 [Dactylosporangium cerinum]
MGGAQFVGEVAAVPQAHCPFRRNVAPSGSADLWRCKVSSDAPAVWCSDLHCMFGGERPNPHLIGHIVPHVCHAAVAVMTAYCCVSEVRRCG